MIFTSDINLSLEAGMVYVLYFSVLPSILCIYTVHFALLAWKVVQSFNEPEFAMADFICSFMSFL